MWLKESPSLWIERKGGENTREKAVVKRNIHCTGIHFSNKHMSTYYMIDTVAVNDDYKQQE